MLSLVIPVYGNEGSLPDLLQAIERLSQELGGDLETVFVVDSSPDSCYEILRKVLPQSPLRSQLILLSRNFGSFIAIRTGLEFARGARFAVMAADLQEPPDLVLQMDALLRQDKADVVLGVRESRRDALATRVFSGIYWAVYRKFVIPEIPVGGVDMFGCSLEFRDTLLTMAEQHSSLIGQIFWAGYRRETIPYARRERLHGKSTWTFRKKWKYMMDSVFSFTDLPIKLLIRVGAAGTLFAALLGSIVLVARLKGMIDVPGYAMTILTIALLSSLNLFGLGIVGAYAWRTYENTKRRPISIKMKSHIFEGKNADIA